MSEAQNNQSDKTQESIPEDNPCPNCGKVHVVACKDKKHRCAKCGWCIEDKAKDFEFLS